ncbi:MAG: IclR family transcriptional regulator [Ectothiorhodospiraceae bacterium]|nr:IclR family transcriptional regulator [Ectothiorhodospiraceae bacterium]MCH8504885.1 IclR family transcriptional regulator [Ectothiorhodospiraceae bacterium]
MEESSLAKPVGAVVNAVRLLRVLASSNKPLGVTAAARAADVNPSTAYHILRTLVHEGLVTFDEGGKTYSLGLGMVTLARKLLGRHQTELLRPELTRLATNFECLFALWQIVDDRVVLIDRALANTAVRLDLEVTQRMPFLLGAIGRAIAARLDMETSELYRRFSELRWNAPMTFEEYQQELEQTRQRGYAVDQERLYSGITAIASVITDDQGRPQLGISAIGFAERLRGDVITRIGSEIARLCAASSGQGFVA